MLGPGLGEALYLFMVCLLTILAFAEMSENRARNEVDHIAEFRRMED
jgi:hypothetical protein